MKKQIAYASQYNDDIKDLQRIIREPLDVAIVKLSEEKFGGDGMLGVALGLAALNRTILDLLVTQGLGMGLEPDDEALKQAGKDIQAVIHRIVNHNHQRYTGADN
jgi:hypothetical protein